MSTLSDKKQRILSFKGAMAAVFTPYDSNGEVDVSAIGPYVKYLAENQVDGVYVIGTTGEGYSLTNCERLAIAKAWREEINKQNANLLISVNVTSTCIKESLKFAKECEQIGIDSIAVLPPNYYKPTSVNDLINYFKLFANAAPNTPLLYYHIPMMVGELPFDIISVVDEGLKQIPQFAAMKFTDNNVIRLSILQKNYRDNFKILCGFDECLLSALTATDCNAGICALFNFPSVVAAYKKLVAAVENLDLEEARRQQNEIIDTAIVHKTSGNFFLSIKSLFNSQVKSLGVDFGVPRPPIHFHYSLL